MKKLKIKKGLNKFELEAFSKTEREELEHIEDVEKTIRQNAEILEKRNIERGSVEKQLELIAEQGLDSWLKREYQIRLNNPKNEQIEPNMPNPNK